MPIKKKKKKLQQRLRKISGKCVLLKDLHNIEQKMRSHLTDDFPGVIKYLHENPPTLKVHIAYNEDGGCVEGLLLMDPQMIDMYKRYPEVIFMGQVGCWVGR